MQKRSKTLLIVSCEEVYCVLLFLADAAGMILKTGLESVANDGPVKCVIVTKECDK
jgi:hypothetical protein